MRISDPLEERARNRGANLHAYRARATPRDGVGFNFEGTFLYTRNVEHNGQVVAHIYDMTVVEGRTFPTPEHFPMQFGIAALESDWTSKAHIHKPVTREVEGTAEFIFIMEGRLDAIFYGTDHTEIGRETLTQNMALLQLTGGHELSFAKGTKYFEIKQGPYLGRDGDKYDL